ncbi:hypothetical protein [Streptomyces sp. NPDC059863]|uniref:hypothetical protein n=1 Tax=unclassified Streptomyces TaxID=2593676 RepID=UPI003660F88F
MAAPGDAVIAALVLAGGGVGPALELPCGISRVRLHLCQDAQRQPDLPGQLCLSAC